MAKDLTIIHYTANQLPEKFDAFTWNALIAAANGTPIISVGRGGGYKKFIEFGQAMFLIDSEPKCLSNIYRQMLRAAKLATTDFVATAEDDCLYHESHFTFFRPKHDEFAYDQHRF